MKIKSFIIIIIIIIIVITIAERDQGAKGTSNVHRGEGLCGLFTDHRVILGKAKVVQTEPATCSQEVQVGIGLAGYDTKNTNTNIISGINLIKFLSHCFTRLLTSQTSSHITFSINLEYLISHNIKLNIDASFSCFGASKIRFIIIIIDHII